MRKNILGCIALSMVLASLVACSDNNIQNINHDTSNDIENDTQIVAAMDTIENMKGKDFETVEVNENTVTKINLNGNSISVEGKGVNVDGNIATIITAGDYSINGTLDDGQIVVDAGENNVTLLLNGANIKSSNSSPIYVKSAKNTIVYLEEGSQNFIEDASTYVYANANEDEPDSAIFSKDDLYISGTGTLKVKANYNDAIKSKDDLSILGGTIVVDSVDDGIVGKDSVSLKNCNVTVNAGGDGIKSTNTEDTTKGYVAIESGTFNITATSDGIQAETDVNIAGGTFKIETGGGSSVSSNTTNSEPLNNRRWGNWETNLDSEDTQSAKGIKATNNLTIIGGTFEINSSDDAIHCNNNIIISGGTIRVLSGDDGIHADNTLTISGGKITIEKSYEGLEAATIKILDGEISVVASDDGINIAGGNDGSAMNGRPGQNNFITSSSSDNYLTIEGGNIFVNATGDGLDANGSIYIKGGKIEVAGPRSSGNGTLDYDRECVITGGEFVGYGSSGMAQNPSSSSTQNIIVIGGNYQANDVIEIKNGAEVVYECVLKKECQSVIISTEKINTGVEYALYVNDEENQTFTASSIITSIGTKTNGGMNNMGGKTGGEKKRK